MLVVIPSGINLAKKGEGECVVLRTAAIRSGNVLYRNICKGKKDAPTESAQMRDKPALETGGKGAASAVMLVSPVSEESHPA